MLASSFARTFRRTVNVDIGQVPEHGTASFTVTMTCLKATLTAASNYRYTLIGDCNLDCVS